VWAKEEVGYDSSLKFASHGRVAKALSKLKLWKSKSLDELAGEENIVSVSLEPEGEKSEKELDRRVGKSRSRTETIDRKLSLLRCTEGLKTRVKKSAMPSSNSSFEST
jgi:hypothetical protein